MRVLRFTALLEGVTGCALLIAPSVVVRLLLGGELSGPGIAVSRVAGVALLALGIACWPGRDPAPARRAMLTYNALVAAYLATLGGGGPLLWPAALLHGALALVLSRRPARPLG